MTLTYTSGLEGATILVIDATEYILICLYKMDNDSKRKSDFFIIFINKFYNRKVLEEDWT
jgi:hypothetical protein